VLEDKEAIFYLDAHCEFLSISSNNVEIVESRFFSGCIQQGKVILQANTPLCGFYVKKEAEIKKY